MGQGIPREQRRRQVERREPPQIKHDQDVGIQGSLADRVGVVLALALASALFGTCRLITWTYAIIAVLIGAFLGLLWVWTGNLLLPMITHAVYDFAALLYSLRVYRGR